MPRLELRPISASERMIGRRFLLSWCFRSCWCRWRRRRASFTRALTSAVSCPLPTIVSRMRSAIWSRLLASMSRMTVPLRRQLRSSKRECRETVPTCGFDHRLPPSSTSSSNLIHLGLVIVHRKLGQLAEERMRLVRAAIEVVVLLTEDEVDAPFKLTWSNAAGQHLLLLSIVAALLARLAAPATAAIADAVLASTASRSPGLLVTTTAVGGGGHLKAVPVVDPVAGGVLFAARTSAAGRKDRSPAGQRPRVGARGLAHLFGVAGLAAHSRFEER
ncbi:hypothetical protein TYRP_007833 [Tyrophagus putrescentiae]|nr:hypothetical protein TYRP_007833 [Tyrophagus putrescentiae]